MQSPAPNATFDSYRAAVRQLGDAIRRGAPAAERERLKAAANRAGAVLHAATADGGRGAG